MTRCYELTLTRHNGTQSAAVLVDPALVRGQLDGLISEGEVGDVLTITVAERTGTKEEIEQVDLGLEIA